MRTGPVMNILSRDKQIEVIAALTEGMGIRATARITGVNRKTVGKLALDVGKGACELHDRIMVLAAASKRINLAEKGFRQKMGAMVAPSVYLQPVPRQNG